MAKSKAKAKVVKYVAIRECFDFGRLWLPMSKAVQEKDYLLQVGADVKVSEKNFMQVKDAPALKQPEAPETKAISEVKAKTGDEFLD